MTPLGIDFVRLACAEGASTQKSIALKTSNDSDSNLVHLFDFLLFVMVVDLGEKQQGLSIKAT